MNPDIFLANLGPDKVDSPGTKDPAAFDNTVENSLVGFREPEYPVMSLANTISTQFDSSILDQGYAVAVKAQWSSGYEALKVAMPGEV